MGRVLILPTSRKTEVQILNPGLVNKLIVHLILHFLQKSNLNNFLNDFFSNFISKENIFVQRS